MINNGFIMSELKGYDIEKEKRKILPALRKMIKPCTTCGTCLQNCEFYTISQKKAQSIMTEIKEYIFSTNLSKKLSRKTRRYIWSCGICEHCINSCPLPPDQRISKSALIMMLRSTLVNKGQAPLIVKLARLLLSDIDTPILKYLWPVAAKLSVPNWYSTDDRLLMKVRLAIEKARKLPTKGAEICLFGGCGHTWGAPDVVYEMMAILEEAGVDFMTIGHPEYCCGVVFAALGFLDLWIEQNYRVIQNYLKLEPRPKKIVLHCPGCTTIHLMDMSKYGVDLPLDHLRKMPNGIEMEHATEFTYNLIKEGKIKMKNPVPLTVTYNDNCSIGRRIGFADRSIYDEPRGILNAIPELNMVESDYVRENAFCCGGVASIPLVIGSRPHVSKVHEKLFRSMLDKGSDILLTPCMGCVIAFQTGANALQKKLKRKIKVMDVLHVVNQSLGIKIPDRGLLSNFSLIDTIKSIRISQVYKDIYRLIKETLIFLLFPKRYNPHKYDES